MQPNNKISSEDFDKLYRFYYKNPECFVTDIINSKPWEKQVEIIQSTFKYKVTAVKTCNAIGKSYIAARIVITYLMLHPNSIVVTTAPTWRQVTDVLWREIGTAIKQAEMHGFKLTDNQVNQAGLNIGTDWFAVGLSTSKPENFFGYHADHILVVVDEAGGVDEAIYRGVAAITPNANAHVLLIGNPTSPSGTFYDYFTKPELGANCITVSAFDTPNFTSTGIRTIEDLIAKFSPPAGTSQADWTNQVNQELEAMMDQTYAGLIAPSVVYGRYHEWGTDSAAWQSLIMGEFPDQAEQSLIPANLVRMAMKMYDIDPESHMSYEEVYGWQIPDGFLHYGQDMARFGNDLNVNTPSHGGYTEKQIVWNKKGDAKQDLVESAMTILRVIDPLDTNVQVNIDDTGNGGGTTDRLREASRDSLSGGNPAHQYTLRPYVMSSKEMMSEKDKRQFADITSKVYWNLRQWFYQKAIALYFDQQLYDELVSRRWGLDKQGRIKVESKDEYKKRTGGKSPDKSDSLTLSYANKKPDGGINVQREPERNRKRDEFDDFPDIIEIAPVTGGLSNRY